MRKTDRLSIFLAVLVFANAGCVSLKQPAPNIHTYAFDLSRPVSAGEAAGKKIDLSIERLSIAAQFDSLLFVYRVGDYEYKRDYYYRFLAKPQVMMTQEAQSWFVQAPYVESLSAAHSKSSSDYRFKGNIQELYGDFRDNNQLKAVLTMQFVLIPPEQAREAFVKVYTQSIAMKDKSATELMAAYNTALFEILKEFEGDLLGEIQ